MGASERRKGHSFERKIASELRVIDPTAMRNLEYQKGDGYDIELENLPLTIQCKSQKRPNLIASLQEAIDVTSSNPKHAGNIPLAICKVTNKGEFAVLRWGDFLTLLKRAYLDV